MKREGYPDACFREPRGWNLIAHWLFVAHCYVGLFVYILFYERYHNLRERLGFKP